MKLYVLDTDICGFVQQEHPGVLSRIRALPGDEVTLATTIITFGEDWGAGYRHADVLPMALPAYVRTAVYRQGVSFIVK